MSLKSKQESTNSSFSKCHQKSNPELVMGPSPGPARARPGPVLFSRDRARNSKKGPSSTQARDRFLEKGLENWDFYVVKNTGSSRLGIKLLWRAWVQARLEINIQGSGSARDRFFKARPITIWRVSSIHLWFWSLNLYVNVKHNKIDLPCQTCF